MEGNAEYRSFRNFNRILYITVENMDMVAKVTRYQFGYLLAVICAPLILCNKNALDFQLLVLAPLNHPDHPFHLVKSVCTQNVRLDGEQD